MCNVNKLWKYSKFIRFNSVELKPDYSQTEPDDWAEGSKVKVQPRDGSVRPGGGLIAQTCDKLLLSLIDLSSFRKAAVLVSVFGRSGGENWGTWREGYWSSNILSHIHSESEWGQVTCWNWTTTIQTKAISSCLLWSSWISNKQH